MRYAAIDTLRKLYPLQMLCDELSVSKSGYSEWRIRLPSNRAVENVALVREIRAFDVILVKSEVEALLLERTLIKHHQPRFNILLRDDKEYPYVRIDDRTYRLAPGGRIYDTFNRIVLPNAAPKTGKVLFKLDQQGNVIKLWILTPEEIARLSQ